MLVGVVKLAPSLPIDAIYPYFHLDQKFMHLGFHIIDLGFQSPDSEAAKPMVFATTFFLILLVVLLNLGAIVIRERLRRQVLHRSVLMREATKMEQMTETPPKSKLARHNRPGKSNESETVARRKLHPDSKDSTFSTAPRMFLHDIDFTIPERQVTAH